jgi:hypothetical protein
MDESKGDVFFLLMLVVGGIFSLAEKWFALGNL